MQPSSNSWMRLPEPNDGNTEMSRLESKLDDLLIALNTSPPYSTPPPGLFSYWRTLKSHALLLVLVSATVAGAAWYLSVHQQKSYQARATMELLEPGRTLTMRNLSNSDRLFASDTYVETQVAKIRSTTVLEAVRQKLGPDLFVPGSPRPVGAEAVLQAIRSNLDVWPIRGTSLIGVSYDAPDPNLAARVVNTLASQYIEGDVEARSQNVEQTRAWLEKELADAKAKLETSEARLQEYANSSGLLFTSVKGNPGQEAEDKLQFIANELSQTQAKRATLEARYDVVASRPPEAPVTADESDVLHGIQTRLLDLIRAQASLASQFTPEYYKLQEVNAEIASLKASEAREYSRWVAELRQEFETERKHEALLEAAYQQQASLVSDQAGKSIHYNVLKREVETNRDLYDALLAGVKEAGVNAAARVRNARVVDAATPPGQPYRPTPVRNAVIGLIVGLMLAAAFVLVSDANDRRLKSPGTAASYLHVPELGVIPSVRPKLLPTARREMIGARRYPAKTGSVADAFHAAFTSIFVSGRFAQPPQVVVVTSASAHEGKSTVVGNLGLMAAQAGKRVLLVDGDLRNPRLHRTYSVSNERGLADLLLKDRALAEAETFEMIQPTNLEGLFVLSGGPPIAHLLPLLHSERMAEVLTQLRTQFDLILVDTPPVLPFPDARLFGRLSDAVVMVVRSGHTSRNLALAAKSRFIDDGLPIIGIILNDWDGKDSAYAYSTSTY